MNEKKTISTATGRRVCSYYSWLALPVFIAIWSMSFLFMKVNLCQQTTKSTKNISASPSSGSGSSEHENKQFSASITNAATGTVFTNVKIRTFDSSKKQYSRDSMNVDVSITNSTIRSNVINDEDVTMKEGNQSCQRWAVVTTIFDPTEAIVRVAKSTSWCLVIVADTKTPKNYTDQLHVMLQQQEEQDNRTSSSEDNLLPSFNIFYLSVEKQKAFENIEGAFGTFMKSTPWKHFARKNVGYLFAVFNGAQFIFDFDDDNFIKIDETTGKPMEILPDGNDMNEMILKNVTVVMQGATAFNHHPMMGASIDDSWARGFPIGLIADNATQGMVAFNDDLPFSGSTLGVTRREIGVLQYLADGNPDIDAIHRLSKKLPMTFRGQSSVLVPGHSYSPYNAQATIHTHNAMFAMLLPATVPGRVSDIWRGYFAQCLFAEVGLSLVFAPSKIDQKRNDHNLLADFEAESDLYCK